MPDSDSDRDASPFTSILEWSRAWPEWQQDALRRIVTTGSLSEEDIKELATLCRSKHGLKPVEGDVPAADPLTADHIPGGVHGTASVSLTKLSSLRNVGRLPSDQKIDFGPSPGLTVIYGENGAGKSGYARVIKKACRARGKPQDIKPNAFAPRPKGPASATIDFRVGEVDTSVNWTDGTPSDPRLGNVFVFDSFSAEHHVGKSGPACFKPRGLDVLPKLAQACDALGRLLQSEIEGVEQQITAARTRWARDGTTSVAKLVNGITANTAHSTIDESGIFTDVDEARLKEVIETLSDDPVNKSAATDAAAKRIRNFAETSKSRAISVDDTAMQQLEEAIQRARATAAAAEAASGPELLDGELPWGDNEMWRELWRAAQKYSETVAYKGKEFPVTDTDAKCVLCQQPLGPEATDRYARFNKFVANETRKEAETAKTKVAELKKAVDALRTITNEADTIKADLEREAPGQFASAQSFASAVDARLKHAQTCLAEGEWVDAPPISTSPCSILLELADQLDERAQGQKAAADPAKAQALKSERDELTDKHWLKENVADVKAQIGRHIDLATLKKCQADCGSFQVSTKAKTLDQQYVSDAFSKAFARECDTLGLKTLSVVLRSAGVTKGEGQFVVVVDGATNTKVDDIASEGEHRCIALAAFLAELSLASHKSALVFDDPVSSLDHSRRIRVAHRLVTEAATRQVVVFTHDIVFLCELYDAIERTASDVHYMHLYWHGDVPGRCEIGLPWDWRKYTDRLDALEKEQRRISRVWSTVPNPTNVSDMRTAYTHLSATLERIVQDVVLNGVIGRYRDWVRVEKLDEVAGITQAECDEVLRIDKKCSNVTNRHDPAAARHAPIPDPKELLEDIVALKNLAEQVKARRKAAKSAKVAQQ